MPFYPPSINPQAQGWKDQANALPAPEGGGHIIDAIAKLLAPQLNRTWGRVVEGKYEGQPWQTIAADALVPDEGAAGGVGEAMGMANPLAAGMVRMGGKEFPNAFLHRALGDPKELDWLASLFQRGRTTQKPTSAVTPSVMSTFGSDPYGLLFNADASKGQIAHAGAADLWSTVTHEPVNAARYRAAQERLYNKYPWDTLEEHMLPNDQKAIGNIRHILEGGIDLTPGPGILEHEAWTPSTPNRLGRYYDINPVVDPKTSTLADLLKLQKQGMLEGSLHKPGFVPDIQILTHSEIIPNIDRSMLAGVRLPMEGTGVNPKMASWLKDQVEPGYNDLVRSLTNFAEQQHIPIYRWPAEMTQAQQLKGLEKPFAGSWGQPPGKDYITSSMLPKIFGITELP